MKMTNTKTTTLNTQCTRQITV